VIIDVWEVPLTGSDAAIAACDGLLSQDERERATQFRFEHLRKSFVRAHGVLRMLLGRYLEVPPEKVVFRYGPKGKPRVNGSVHFNLSHSGELALVAVADCEVGVDVEKIRAMDDLGSVARRFFRPEEASRLLALPLDRQAEAFFACWTRKEAHIKALGDGMSIGLDKEIGEEWNVEELDMARGYAAAVAYMGPRRDIRRFIWTEF
jgi:4'-phosphopantetheinyl transferase